MQRLLAERELTSEGPRRKGGATRRRRSVTVNLAESPLGWLHAHGHLDDRLFDAGERLRGDYEQAQLSPDVTMRWEPVRIRATGPRLSPSERQVAARQRFDGAIAAAGKGLEDILWRVVCACETLPVAEKALDWRPARASWCSGWRSTGWPISTASGEAEFIPLGHHQLHQLCHLWRVSWQFVLVR